MVERIRSLCKAQGTSITKLEAQLGFGNGVIGRWNKSRPSYDRLTKVANALSVTPEYLLTGENEQKEKPRDENINEAIGPNKAAVLNEISDFTPEELALLRANIKKIKESRI